MKGCFCHYHIFIIYHSFLPVYMMIVLLTPLPPPTPTLRGKNLGSSKAHKSGGAPGVTLAQLNGGFYGRFNFLCYLTRDLLCSIGYKIKLFSKYIGCLLWGSISIKQLFETLIGKHTLKGMFHEILALDFFMNWTFLQFSALEKTKSFIFH